ncbi:MAG: type II/IV secretion system ATPase subunit [Candidatus Hadarchaeales archaeon]
MVKGQPAGGEKAQEPGPLEEDLLLAELDKKLEEKEAQVEEQASSTPEPIQESAIPEAPAGTTGESEAEDKTLGAPDAEEDAFLNELLGVIEEKETSTGSTAVPTTPVEVQAEAVGEEVVEEVPVDAGEAIRSIVAAEDEIVKELGEKYSALEQVRAPQEFLEFCTFEIPPGYRELERYWITRPYVWAAILYSPERNERLYYLVEPSLTPGEKMALERLHEHLIDRLVYTGKVKDRDRAIAIKVGELLKEYGITLTSKSLKKILYYLKRNYIGYGKIDGLLRDPNIEDISCDGLNVPIFIYSRRYQSLRTNIIFTDSTELDLFVIRLVEKAGKQITFGKPTVDAALPEGYRLQATLGTEVTTRGSSFSIRKYSEEPFTPIDLLAYGTFSAEMLAYLWLATENKKNIFVVGGTASGKTSTLNALSMFIWPDAKIVSIEDTRELALYQENWIPSITRPAPGEKAIEMFDLLRQALRQRPEVIIVGEVRGKEALTMFQAMSTGHTCYSTMHAGSIQEMVHRLEGEPINVPHHMLAALDIVCLQLLTYYRDQRVRRNQSIVEIVGIDPSTGALRTNRIFERNPLTDEFERVGESQVLREIARERGWSALELERELKRRQQVLEFLYKNNIRRLHEVAIIFRQYYFEPEKVMEQIISGKLSVE